MPKQAWAVHRNFTPIPEFIPWATGRFYTSPLATGTGSTGISTSIPSAQPIYVPNIAGVTVTSIGCEVTVSAASQNMRIGIYSCGQGVYQGYPGRLIEDSGAISVASTGFQSATISTYLRQGWYWLVFMSTGGSYRTHAASISAMRLGGWWVDDTATAPMAWQTWNDAPSVSGSVSFGLPGGWTLNPDGNPYAPTTSNIPRVMVGI